MQRRCRGRFNRVLPIGVSGGVSWFLYDSEEPSILIVAFLFVHDI